MTETYGIPELEIVNSILGGCTPLKPPVIPDGCTPLNSDPIPEPALEPTPEQKSETKEKPRKRKQHKYSKYRWSKGRYKKCNFMTGVANCHRDAIFGFRLYNGEEYVGLSRERCTIHRELGMVSCNAYYCKFPGCGTMASFGFPKPPGEKMVRGDLRKIKNCCGEHAEPGMVNIDQFRKRLRS